MIRKFWWKLLGVDLLNTKLDMLLWHHRRIQLQLARMETTERNRRILAQEQADHAFKPVLDGDDGGDATCAVPDCLVPRRQHEMTSEVTG